MQTLNLEALIRILQIAISPVALISGVGLLVLSMTNRFARTTDRARLLNDRINGASTQETEVLTRQITILYRRSRVLLFAIGFALGSVLLAGLLIISLFAIHFFKADLQDLIVLLFVLSIVCLVIGVLLFIQDMSLSLQALREELRGRV